MSLELYAKDAFDAGALKRICEMHEDEFAEAYELVHVPVAQRVPDDFYLFKDNRSDVLAVAHLDTVAMHFERTAHYAETEAGLVIHSRALDDRLGAYIILEMLPRLGLTYDWLLTVGEEAGRSTAEYFDTEKQYNWMIEFDRGGTDVVMYQYEDSEVREMVRNSGARIGDGIFSDICYLEHLEIKGFNWGTGYRDYHGPRSHAYLEDTFEMVDSYVRFHDQNEGTAMPHWPNTKSLSSWGGWRYGGWNYDYEDAEPKWPGDEDKKEAAAEVVDLPPRECDTLFGYHDHDEEDCARLIELMNIGVNREGEEAS